MEVQAPYGYVLNSEPVYFDVVQENSEEESGITVIEVVRSNMAQKGTITVEKSGEVFSSVAGDKGLYQPIFSVSGLEGAVYEITAAEDIVTLDGTVRANKGEVVDTVTTGKDGTVKSKELYLGKYEVKEITAPYGMVLNEEVHSVELVYAGQNVDVTETATSFYNERQRVEIDLIKSLAIDEAYGIGKNDELPVYRESFRVNMACRDALESAIHESYHDYCLDTGKAAAQVAAQFGMERVAYVLANTVRAFDHDGRISRDNKAWAQTVPVCTDADEWGHERSRYFLVSQVNPGLVNLLVSRVREELAKEKAAPEKRPSVLEKIQKNKTAIQAKTAEKKLLGQER